MTLLQDLAACVFLFLLGFCALCMWLSGQLPSLEAV